MRLLWAILLLFSLLNSCQVENPVTGKVFVFTPTIDPSLPETFIFLEELAFINEEEFILSYSENYHHLFVKGTYTFRRTDIQLLFEKTAYESVQPDLPAISAVDTNEYIALIRESNCNLKELSLNLNDNHNEVMAELGNKKQTGFQNGEIDLETFKKGLEIQQLDFLLKND